MADKLTYQDFSAKVKEKYPQYKDVDDYELASKMVEKYPQYGEQVDLKKKEETQVGAESSQSLAEPTTTVESKYTPEEVEKFKQADINPRTIMGFGADMRNKYSQYKQEQVDQNKITAEQRIEAKESIGFIDEAISDVKSSLSGSDTRESTPWWARGVASGSSATGSPSETFDTSPQAQQQRDLATQLRLLKETKTYLNAVANGDKQSAIKRFWEGAKTLDVANAVSFGLKDMLEGVDVAAVGIKLQNEGEEALTQEEKDILILDNLRRNAESTAMQDRSFAVGQGIAETVPFIADMMLTSGIGTSIRKGTFKGASELIKSKAARKLVSNLSDATVRSLLFPSTYENAAARMTPDVGFNEEGDPVIMASGDDFVTAMGKSIGENAVEIFSEGYVGEGLNKGISRLSAKGMKALSGTKISQVISAVDKAAKNSPVLKMASIQDPISEFGEEVFAGIVQPIVTGEGSPMDFFEYENMVRTALTVGVMSSAMTTVSVLPEQGSKAVSSMIHNKKVKEGINVYESLDDENKRLFNDAVRSESIDEMSEKVQAINLNMLDEDSSEEQIKTSGKSISRLSDYIGAIRVAQKEASKIDGATYQYGEKVFTEKDKFFKAYTSDSEKGKTVPFIEIRNDNTAQKELDAMVRGVEVTPTTEEEAATKTKQVETPIVEQVSENPQKPVEAVSKEKGTTTPTEEESGLKTAQKQKQLKKQQEDEKQVQQTEGAQAPEEVSKEEVDKVSETTGIKPKSIRDSYKAGRDVFGLNRSQALAQAIIVDKVVGKIAEKTGGSKEDVYGTVEFRKSELKDLTPKGKKLYQIIGQNANLKQTVREDLSVAREMETSGKDAKTIRQATGWEKGADGKWKYEIQDPTVDIVKYGNFRLKDLVKDKSLLETYPQLKDYKVELIRRREGSTIRGTFQENKKNIAVYGNTKADLKSSLYHEIQHAIQGIEGFAKGARKEQVGGRDQYLRQAGEVESRNVQNRIGMTDEQRRGILLEETEGVGRDEQIVLFQKGQGAKGAIQFMEDGSAIIHALTDPNVSTPLHEIAHLYEQYMTDAERKAVLSWVKDKEWTVNTSEKFARGFEKYLAEGKAPTPALQKVFDKLKEWLTDIYNGITGSEIDIKLNKPMRDLYASMLGAEAVKRTSRAESVQQAAKKVAEITDDNLSELAGKIQFQDTDAKFQGAVTPEQWLNTVIDAAEQRKVDPEKLLRDQIKKLNLPFKEEQIINILKQRGYAKETSRTTKKASEQTQGLEQGEEERLRVRNAKQDQENGRDEKVRTESHKPKKPTGEKVKKGRFASRVSLEKTQVPQEVKDQFNEGNIGEYTVLSDDSAKKIADTITEQSTYDEMADAVFDANVHPSIRGYLMLNLSNMYSEEFYKAEKEGNESDIAYWADKQIDFLKRIDADVSRPAAQALRFLGTKAAMEVFAPYVHERKYKRETEAQRDKAINTSSHKKSSQRVKKAAKKAHSEAVEQTLEDKEVNTIINQNKPRVESPVKPDRLKELKKKEADIKDKWKAARKSSASATIIPGLTQADIEFGGELAINYLEQAAYHVGKATKKLIKAFKDMEIELTEEQAQKLMPKEIDGVKIEEKIRKEETEKAAERLANSIFGEVVAKESKSDPISQMVTTLLGKFKERDIEGRKKTPKTDIQKIAEAIANKEEYKAAWDEARQMAIDKVEQNEPLTEGEKELAKERIENSYKKATNFTFTEAQVDRAIKRKAAELDIRIKDIVREFYDIRSAERGKLVDALKAESGLSDNQSEILARAIERRFDTIMADNAKKIIDTYVGKIKEGKTTQEKAESKQRKAAEQELLELINVGAFDSVEFREAYATAVGIPAVNDEHAKNIKDFAKSIQSQKRETMKHRATQELLGYMQGIGGLQPSDMLLAMWYANVLGNVKTQERNIVGGLSGVGLRVAAEALYTGRIYALGRGLLRGVSVGSKRFKDVWKEGYAPFSEKIEAPHTSEIFRSDAVGFKHYWNNIKYVTRFMNAADLFNATLGKEAFASLLAAEYNNVSRWKALVSPSYRKQVNEMMDRYLAIDKETVDRKRKEIEAEAEEMGYTPSEIEIILLEEIDKLRPTEVTEEASRFGVYGTGNVDAYGTIGFFSDMVAKGLRGFSMTVWTDKKGKQYKIAPLSLFAAFTKIAGNVATMSLNYVPGVGLYRIQQGGYGRSFIMSKDSKYAVDLTPREKKTVLAQQVLGTVAMATIYALSAPGDDNDPLIRITANGTGDYQKNRSLQDWKEYSIGIKTGENTRLWIPYKYTPLIIPFGIIGLMRDSKAYKKEYKDSNELDLLGQALLSSPSFIGDMTAVGSMVDVMEGLMSGLSKKGGMEAIGRNMQRTISSFYTPGIYRDAVDILETTYGLGVEEPIKGTPFYDIETQKKAFFGKNPVSVIRRVGSDGKERTEYVDAYGRTTDRKYIWEDLVSTKTLTQEDKLIMEHEKKAEVPSTPNVNSTFFMKENTDGSYTKIALDQADKKQSILWHQFLKKRGEYILQAIKDNNYLQGEEYQQEMTSAYSQATEDAKWDIEYELNKYKFKPRKRQIKE